MNKLFLGIFGLFFGSFVAYYVVNGENNYFTEVKNLAEKHIIHSQAKTSEPKEEDIFDVQVLKEEKKLEKVRASVLSETKKFVKCLKEKKCLKEDENKRFYNSKRDPKWVKVAEDLNKINDMSEFDESLLEQVTKEELNYLMSYENEDVFFVTNILLYKKGKDSILSSQKVVSSLETKLLTNYLVNLSNSHLIKDNEVREMRNNIIKTQLKNRRPSGIFNAVNALNSISFEQSEVKELKNSFCELELKGENEPQKILEAKFATFLKKYQVNSDC